MQPNKTEPIGELSYFGHDGKIVESMKYYDKNEFIDVLKSELDYNPQGFKFKTLTDNPEVVKAVDDVVYDFYGEDNPHSIEHYINKANKSKNNMKAYKESGFNYDNVYFDTKLKIDVYKYLLKNGYSSIIHQVNSSKSFVEVPSHYTDKLVDAINKNQLKADKTINDKRSIEILNNIRNGNIKNPIYTELANDKRFDFSNESKEKNEIFDKRDLMTKDKDWNGLESTEGAIYNNEAKIQLKAGMYLENMGVHKKGSTVDMLVEKGWDKEHLNNLSKNISNVINKADNKRISDINIFSLKTGGFAIRCKIDGEQQSAEKMTREDVINFTDKTDRFQLASKYFQSALEEQRKDISIKR